MNARSGGRLIAYTVLVLVLLLLAGIIIYYSLSILHLIPLSFSTYIKVLITGIVGYVAIFAVGRELQRALRSKLGPSRAYSVLFIFRLASYLLLVALMLGVAGVSATALLAGGTFAGLVVGLASQTVLSNLAAGLLVVFAKPFSVGDRVTAFGWQYGMSFPFYSPKFYSEDKLIPSFTGRVVEITMNYTSILLDDGVTVKIPNNVVVTMAFIIQEVDSRWVRVRYELPPTMEDRLEEFIDLVREEVKKNEWVIDPSNVKVNVEAITQSSILLVVDAQCRGSFEDTPRTSLLKTISSAKRKMASAKASTNTSK
jgi:small-conductance mechanosensitive channel